MAAILHPSYSASVLSLKLGMQKKPQVKAATGEEMLERLVENTEECFAKFCVCVSVGAWCVSGQHAAL